MTENNEITSPQKFEKILKNYFDSKAILKVLNIGAKTKINKDYDWINNLSKGIDVYNLEYDKNFVIPNDDHYILGDICDCPSLQDNFFDIVYMVNVLEHVKEPWKAADECIRVCKKNGIIIVSAPFAWYYHKHPIDFWRFSPDCLEFLFSRGDMTVTLNKGFKGDGWFEKKVKFKGNGVESIYLGRKK
jgi:SAM-dependent methyltransferase